MGNCMTLKPPNLGKNLIVDTAPSSAIKAAARSRLARGLGEVSENTVPRSSGRVLRDDVRAAAAGTGRMQAIRSTSRRPVGRAGGWWSSGR